MNIAQMSPEGLPEPGPEERAHSARVADRVRSEIIGRGGRMSFARYMDVVLNAPGLGYYRAPNRHFGRDGDFITAPELSPLFARCIARQVDQMLSHLGGGMLFEAGAGSGVLCAGLLNTLNESGRLPQRYLILEPSAGLRARQRETLEQLAPDQVSRVVWVDDLPPTGFIGIVIANELLDAIPAPRFKKSANHALEACVETRGAGFDWTYDAPKNQGLVASVKAIEAELGEPFAEGYTSELGCAREAWLCSAALRLRRGAMLVLDYGYTRSEYYHPQRRDGTLTCYYRHRVHADPFFWPGIQDISVHVDFSGLCRAAADSGLEIAGFTTQAEFLMATGLLDSCRRLDPQSPDFIRLTAQIKRLTLPGEMGELVKVLALTKGMDCPLMGFSGRDYRGRL